MESIVEALACMWPAVTPRGPVRVALDRALGRVVATELVARWDLPPFDNSAMDGYAVRAADIASASGDAPCTPEQRDGRAARPPRTPADRGRRRWERSRLHHVVTIDIWEMRR